MPHHHHIDYVEYPSGDLERTKAFFVAVFGWTFQDFGPEYTAFSAQGLDGGFFLADQASATSSGAALLIFYSDDLEASQDQIIAAGGSITRPTFSFPGGKRFHFAEPMGNEFAVWTAAQSD